MTVRIGITGGIGSGKSYVCRRLAERGIPVYDCDTAAKRLMTQSEKLRNAITALVGSDAYIYNGIENIVNEKNDDAYIYNNECWSLNKPVVAAYLFADESNAAAINAAVHPAVREDFLRWADSQTADIVAMESAILFESGFDSAVDKTIEVYAPKDLRLARAMQRDNATAAQIEARMAKQMDEEEKRSRADLCIVNDGADIEEQIGQLLNAIERGQIKQKSINRK